MSVSQAPIGSGWGVEAVDFSPAEFCPAENVRHQTAYWRGVQMEAIQAISHASQSSRANDLTASSS